MAKKEPEVLIHQCVELADRMTEGFEEAVGASKGKLKPETRLVVGIRGALGAVRADTNAGWLVKRLGRALAHKGVTEDVD